MIKHILKVPRWYWTFNFFMYFGWIGYQVLWGHNLIAIAFDITIVLISAKMYHLKTIDTKQKELAKAKQREIDYTNSVDKIY